MDAKGLPGKSSGVILTFTSCTVKSSLSVYRLKKTTGFCPFSGEIRFEQSELTPVEINVVEAGSLVAGFKL